MIFALVRSISTWLGFCRKAQGDYLCAAPEQIIMSGAATGGLVNAAGAGSSEAAANKESIPGALTPASSPSYRNRLEGKSR